MPLQIGICDDCVEDIKMIKEALYAYEDSFNIMEYIEGEDLIEDCVQHKIAFDILFLDIYMPRLNGIEIAKKIRTYMKYVKIVFVSSSKEYYPEAYDVFAFNYIIKPINREKLTSVLDQALMNINEERRTQICISYKGLNYHILCRDILYIESRDKTVMFHLSDSTTLQCYSKLDEILKQVAAENIIRCHQSFAVNIFHIKEMAEHHFRIGQAVINISKKYQKEAKDKYFAYLFKHMNNRGQ